ncbi:hypothetical protein F7725_019682 [Dissostichus mawsoni]|uniref:WxxW domain-containing protein n=1 Tax=Dissostichus mawsoni TaxID=36200 RepID=A0A7J5YLC4_DISMA|nr:hypothetical protein F7725_019682 [Dissostichus mawsoni]
MPKTLPSSKGNPQLSDVEGLGCCDCQYYHIRTFGEIFIPHDIDSADMLQLRACQYESHQRVPGPEDPEYPKGPEDPEDPVVKPVCWTDWFDRDNPSGSGDWELSSDLRKENPGKICDYPLYIEVVTTDTMTPATSTGENFYIFNPTQGFVCRKKDQKSRECRDYKVRFGCPCRRPAEPCGVLSVAIVATLFLELPCDYATHIQCWTDWFDRDDPTVTGDWETFSDLYNENPGKICPKPLAIEATTLSGLMCWTDWFDRDNPDGSGDWEHLSLLRRENPGKICKYPLYIEVVTTDTMTPAISTGENFQFLNPTQGFFCLMKDQKSGECRDYKVRFGCPCKN